MTSIAIFIAALLAISLPEASIAQKGCGCARIPFRRSVSDMKNTLKSDATNGINVTLVDGDMVFSRADRLRFAGYRAADTTVKRWTRGNIRYFMGGVDEKNKQEVRNALRILSEKTQGCVSFTEYTTRPTGPHVVIQDRGGCFSSVGMYDNGQVLSLGQYCYSQSTIQHEFIHALGFYHEQSRPDRDQNIGIYWENINSATCHNFQICKACKTYGPYDTKSIMHYYSKAFTCDDSKNTMVEVNGKIIPWNYDLTTLDIHKIRTHYECRGSGPSPVQK
jgi:hypothetical protein